MAAVEAENKLIRSKKSRGMSVCVSQPHNLYEPSLTYKGAPREKLSRTHTKRSCTSFFLISRASISALSATDVWLAKGQRDTTLRSSAQGGDSGTYPKHTRELSLQVNYNAQDVKRMAEEIYEETTADDHSSLFVYWIRESSENFDSRIQHTKRNCVEPEMPDAPGEDDGSKRRRWS